MDADSPPPIALRIGDQDHALEPGRTYLVGNGAGCDLRLPDADVAPHHLRLELRAGRLLLTSLAAHDRTAVNGEVRDQAILRVGDHIRIGATSLRIVRDLGMAMIVPDPLLRTTDALPRPDPDAAVGGPAAGGAEAEALDPATALALFPPGPATAAPAAARTRRRSAAALPLRDQGEAAFADLMADELRRAPWLLLSTLLHGLLLLLLWWWFLQPENHGRLTARIGFAGELGPEPTAIANQGVEAPIVQELPESNPMPEPPVEPLPEPVAGHDDPGAPDFDAGLLLAGNERIGGSPGGSSAGASLDQLTGGGGADQGGFRATVSELRRTGLEIMFVFDSTGSMSNTIAATKQQIAEMLEALRALVPDARFGLVTFRDRKERDDSYLLRSVPLGQDFWRACNFMQFIEAGGGGDRPEALDAGLREAFEQPWKPGARRVVVLAGDAPCHAEHEHAMLQAVARFTRDGRSFVHTMTTAARGVDEDTAQLFARIAKDGRGASLDSRNVDELMQKVLSLAFGRQHEQTLAQVLQVVRSRSGRLETWALDAVREDGNALLLALRRDPVPEALLRALVQNPRRATAIRLVTLLAERDCPAHTRHAVAWAVQRILALDLPPVDLTGGELPAREVRRLQMLANRLPG